MQTGEERTARFTAKPAAHLGGVSRNNHCDSNTEIAGRNPQCEATQKNFGAPAETKIQGMNLPFSPCQAGVSALTPSPSQLISREKGAIAWLAEEGALSQSLTADPRSQLWQGIDDPLESAGQEHWNGDPPFSQSHTIITAVTPTVPPWHCWDLLPGRFCYSQHLSQTGFLL